MFNLPLSTHRNLLEPVSGHAHLRKTLISRFLGFIEQIRKSRKMIPKLLLSQISHDVRSTSGKNLRNILLQTEKYDVDELVKSDVRCISYHQLDEEDDWKARLLNELIDTREEKLNLDEFNENEIGDLITFICTS